MTHFNHRALPIRPVLDDGFIIFARFHSDNIRIVSLENPDVHYRAAEEFLFDLKKSFTGYGRNYETAFDNALHQFHCSNPNYKTLYSAMERTFEIRKTIAKLDSWLITYRGKLRVVSDFDGTVLARLEGVSRLNNSGSEYLFLEGSGKTFHDALWDVLEKPIKTNPKVLQAQVIEIEEYKENSHAEAVKQRHQRPVLKVIPAERVKIKIQQRAHLS